MRIEEHPVRQFDRGEKVSFFYNGQKMEGYSSETIAAALHAAGVRRLGHSPELHRPRGLYDGERRAQCAHLRHPSGGRDAG